MFHSVLMQSVYRKPYIANLEIWTNCLWTVRPFDYDLIQMDDYSTDSCAVISHTALLLKNSRKTYKLCGTVPYENLRGALVLFVTNPREMAVVN